MTTIEDLKELMLSVQSDVKASISKMDNISKEVKSLKVSQDQIREDLINCNSRCLVLEKKNARFGKEIASIEMRMELLEIKERAKNIILYNIQYSSIDRENLLETVQLNFRKAEIVIPNEGFESIFVLGKKMSKDQF